MFLAGIAAKYVGRPTGTLSIMVASMGSAACGSQQQTYAASPTSYSDTEDPPCINGMREYPDRFELCDADAAIDPDPNDSSLQVTVSPPKTTAAKKSLGTLKKGLFKRDDFVFQDVKEIFLEKLASDEKLRQQQATDGLEVYRDENFDRFWSIPELQVDILGYISIQDLGNGLQELSVLLRQYENPAAPIRDRIQKARNNPDTWYHEHGDKSLRLGAVIYADMPDENGNIDQAKDIVVSVVARGRIKSFFIVYGEPSNSD